MTPTIAPALRAIYLPAEVASYLRAASPHTTWAPSPAQVYGWIRRGLLASAFRGAPETSIVLDFDDLVTGQAISLLRAAGISLRDIERAEEFFADLYGVDRPYAHRHFWTSGRDIFGDFGDMLIAGTRGGQLAMPFMKERRHAIETRLAFDTNTGRPISWLPASHVDLRPTMQSGQPCVSGTSILTTSIWRYARGNDTLGMVASRLGLDQSEVEAALAWEHARAYGKGATA
jgi:uncharacterized protein (DUF433 family)